MTLGKTRFISKTELLIQIECLLLCKYINKLKCLEITKYFTTL